MAYKRDYLDELSRKRFGSWEHQKVNQTFLHKLTAKEELSLAEEEYICTAISIMRSDETSIKLNPFDFEGCKNYWFRNRYMLYFNDLEAYGRTIDFNGEVDAKQRSKDRDFIESEYQTWKKIIDGKASGDKVLDYIRTETHHHIKLLEKHCKVAFIGHFKKEYLKKSIVLHGRYIYFLVKEYYQELGQEDEKIDMYGHSILIDSYCYIHILFRHYASLIKTYQNDKTYHFDENIDFRTIPRFLSDIIVEFKNSFTENNFDERSINFTFNKKTYTIWFRPFTVHKPKKVIETHLRLQTFYPVELPSDIKRIDKLTKVDRNESLSFLIRIK